MSQPSNDAPKTEPKPQPPASGSTVPETRLKIRSKVRADEDYVFPNANETLLV